MKYSLSLDCAITLFVWVLLGCTFMGLAFAMLFGLVASIKIASIWNWYKTPVLDPRVAKEVF